MDAAVEGRGGLVALQSLFTLSVDGLRDAGGFVVVKGGAERVVGGQRDAVNPVRVARQGREQDALVWIPDLDRLILRAGIELLGPAPAHAGDGGFVPGQRMLDALGDCVPDADRRVFRGGGETWEGRGWCVLAVIGLPG